MATKTKPQPEKLARSTGDLAPTNRPLGWLRPDPRNARTHDEKQVRHLADLIAEFGWTSAIVADETGNILAGHGRLKAARLLGLAEAPVIVVEGWSEEDKRIYRLADNKVALAAGWDDELLALELGDLVAADADVALAGFSDEDLAALLGPSEAAVASAAVKQIETGAVADVFWIQIGGPLAEQADVLARLRALYVDYPHVEIRLGTTARDA